MRARTREDWLALLGALTASLCVTWLLYANILPFSGKIGFVIWWYLTFVVTYAAVAALAQPWPIVLDRIASATVHGGAAVAGSALVGSVLYTFVKGWPAYRHLNFYTHDMGGVGPQDALTHGGILHAIVGSGVELGIATVVSLPLGLITAVYMTEVGGRLSAAVRTVIEAMTALPDLVAGLFIYAVLVVGLGEGRTGLAAALALSITMLPIIARSSEVVLRGVSSGLREASLALGAPQWRTVFGVVLPTARAGLGTALILGMARAVGETAPVLITSGASTYFNANPFSEPMNSLPLFIFTAVRSGEARFEQRGYGAAAVLLFVVLFLFVVVRLIARDRSSR